VLTSKSSSWQEVRLPSPRREVAIIAIGKVFFIIVVIII
jgi:hypothetical protein